MRRFVQQEGNGRRACIVGVLNQFMENSHAIRVQLEDVVQPACERLVLPESLDVLLAEREGVSVPADEPSPQRLRAKALSHFMRDVQVNPPPLSRSRRKHHRWRPWHHGWRPWREKCRIAEPRCVIIHELVRRSEHTRAIRHVDVALWQRLVLRRGQMLHHRQDER